MTTIRFFLLSLSLVSFSYLAVGQALTDTGSEVGIGISNPTGLLHLRKNLASNIGPTLKFENSQYSNSHGAGSGLMFFGNSENRNITILGLMRKWGKPDRIEFNFEEDGSVTNTMTLKYNGRVGIGTKYPSQELEVVGSIRQTGAGLYFANAEKSIILRNSKSDTRIYEGSAQQFRMEEGNFQFFSSPSDVAESTVIWEELMSLNAQNGLTVEKNLVVKQDLSVEGSFVANSMNLLGDSIGITSGTDIRFSPNGKSLDNPTMTIQESRYTPFGSTLDEVALNAPLIINSGQELGSDILLERPNLSSTANLLYSTGEGLNTDLAWSIGIRKDNSLLSFYDEVAGETRMSLDHDKNLTLDGNLKLSREGVPSIDFQNSPADSQADASITLIDDNTLSFDGSDLSVEQSMTVKQNLTVDGVFTADSFSGSDIQVEDLELNTLRVGEQNQAGGINFIRGSGGETGFVGYLGGGSESHNFAFQNTTGGGYFTFHTNGSGSGEKMRITNDGNVGIGITEPSRKLTVGGGIYATSEVRGLSLRANGEIETDKSNNTKFQFARNDWSGSHAILFNAYMDVSANANLFATGNTKYANDAGDHANGAGGIFFNANYGNLIIGISPATPTNGKDSHIDWGTPKMYINRDGEVGIGTTVIQDYRLSVAGKIRAEEIKVETGWADYVFEDDYELKTLEETEAYIKANKHLPGIPSAREVASNGIYLGEMNAKLLEKIEELTLHTIEQQKVIEKQQELLEQFQNRLTKLEQSND